MGWLIISIFNIIIGILYYMDKVSLDKITISGTFVILGCACMNKFLDELRDKIKRGAQ